MRAGLYARVSTEEQADNYSIPSQMSVLREYAQKRGYEVRGEYIDIGYSATTTRRPELQGMLRDIASNSIGVVIARNVDRLVRGVSALSIIMEQLDAADCRLEFVDFTYDGSPMGLTMLEITASIGRMERDLFAQRSRAGRIQKAKVGKVNPPPWARFGYDFDGESQTFVINGEEAHIVRQAFQWSAEGLSDMKITQRFNTLGVPTKFGRLGRRTKGIGWHLNMVSKILSSSEYYGEGYAMRWTRTKAGKKVQRPPEEWVPFSYPPIIDKDLFEAAQEQRRRHKRLNGPREKGVQFLLNGLLYCRECGLRFATKASWPSKRLKDGTLVHYYDRPLKRNYICNGMGRYGHLHNCRKRANIWAPWIEDEIWRVVKDALQNPELILSACEAYAESSESEKASLVSEIETIKKRLDTLLLEEHRLITAYRKGLIDEGQLTVQKKAVTEERQAYAEEALRLEVTLNQKQRSEGLGQILKQAQAAIDHVDERSMEDKRELLRALIDRIWVDRDGNIIIEAAVKELQPSAQLPASDSVGVSTDQPCSWC